MISCQLSGGLTTPGLSSVTAEPLSYLPRLRKGESNTSVIVIEWGESPTNIAESILYEVDFTLTPFGDSAKDPVKMFVSFYPLLRIVILHVVMYMYGVYKFIFMNQAVRLCTYCKHECC